MKLEDFNIGDRVRHIYPTYETGTVESTRNYTTAAPQGKPMGEIVHVRLDEWKPGDPPVVNFKPDHLEKLEPVDCPRCAYNDYKSRQSLKDS